MNSLGRQVAEIITPEPSVQLDKKMAARMALRNPLNVPLYVLSAYEKPRKFFIPGTMAVGAFLGGDRGIKLANNMLNNPEVGNKISSLASKINLPVTSSVVSSALPILGTAGGMALGYLAGKALTDGTSRLYNRMIKDAEINPKRTMV